MRVRRLRWSSCSRSVRLVLAVLLCLGALQSHARRAHTEAKMSRRVTILAGHLAEFALLAEPGAEYEFTARLISASVPGGAAAAHVTVRCGQGKRVEAVLDGDRPLHAATVWCMRKDGLSVLA